MKTAMLAGVFVLLVGLAVMGQYHYAFYYDLSGGQDVEVNLINTMPWEADVEMAVHDAYGGEIWVSEVTLAGYEAAFVQFGGEIPIDPYHWGVVTVDSDTRLIIGLEYYADGLLISVDTVYSEVPVLDPEEPFWLGTYYTQAGDAETAYIVMNPWPVTARCSVSAYDANGEWLDTWDYVLGPYESEYVYLGDSIGYGGTIWGFLDVSMEDVSVIVALEYSGRGCSGLEIDNVTEYYF
jgi:hypothetical protein